MKSTLAEIAASMYLDLRQRPFGMARFPLSGGLVLILSRNEPRWRLTLRRVNVFPSDNEVRICVRAWGVPEGTEPVRRVQRERVSAHATVTWFCVDLIWREIESPMSSEAACAGCAATA